MSNYDDIGKEFDWNDEIENDSPEFIVLPEGDYDFKVIYMMDMILNIR